MAQDRDRWHPLVSRVMNFWVHKMWGIYWLTEDLLASQEGFCSMKLVTQSVNS
jgi:hypothetical protein